MPQVLPISLVVAIDLFYFSKQTAKGKPKQQGFFSFSLGSRCGDFLIPVNSRGCPITKLKKGKLYLEPLS